MAEIVAWGVLGTMAYCFAKGASSTPVEREVTLRQTTLKRLNRSSASILGGGGRRPNVFENWVWVTHMVLDVGGPNGFTRFELEALDGGGIKPHRRPNGKNSLFYSSPLITFNKKGKTKLTDDQIEKIANDMVKGDIKYRVGHVDCQTFAIILFDKIAFEKPWLIELNGRLMTGQQKLAKWLGIDSFSG